MALDRERSFCFTFGQRAYRALPGKSFGSGTFAAKADLGSGQGPCRAEGGAPTGENESPPCKAIVLRFDRSVLDLHAVIPSS
jgi:hypothetical protein